MKLIFSFIIIIALLAPVAARAQDADALLEALVEVKVLKPADVECVKAKLAQDYAKTSAGKLKLSTPLTELELSGDTRFRYQYDQADAQLNTSDNVNQRSRWRFRLRLNADFKVGEDFFGGFSLATGQASDSNMQTFEDGFDNFNVYINKAFVGYRPTNWATVIVGKQANPLYTTDLVWDPDINPQGLVEIFDISKAWFPDSKLSLSVVGGQYVFDDNNEFNSDSDLNTDAFLFAEQAKATWKFDKDTSVTAAPGFLAYNAAELTGLRNTRGFTDAIFGSPFLPSQSQTTITNSLETRIVYGANGVPTRVDITPVTTTDVEKQSPNAGGDPRVFSKTTTVQRGATSSSPIAGVATNLALAGQTVTTTETNPGGTRTIVVKGPGVVSGETRNLSILTAPGDISFKLAGIKTKVYWDFAYNVAGRERSRDTYGLSGYSSRDSLSWLAGLQIGQNKAAGDILFTANYREVGIASIDPNLNDSDFALSALNVRGFKLVLAYNITSAVSTSFAFSHAWNLRDNLTGGQATGNSAVANLNNVDVFQVDLNVKF